MATVNSFVASVTVACGGSLPASLMCFDLVALKIRDRIQTIPFETIAPFLGDRLLGGVAVELKEGATLYSII